jgi:hypothetical protein
VSKENLKVVKVSHIKIPYSEANVKKFSEFLEPKFELLKWEWFDCGIPKRENIEETFRTLINDLEEGTRISAGGLIVDRDKKRNLWLGISNHKFKKVISEEEIESFLNLKKKSKRMLRFT